MTKKTRTILFLVFLFLFFLTAPLIILYSQGYRFDFENKKISQTGGFFLKGEPKQLEIYINGKLAKTTERFFFGSALIENLLPKRYKIEVKKEGYLTWEKNLEIKEKEVTEVKSLVLFPKNMNFRILTKGKGSIKNFWFSPDGKKIILKEKEEQGWALKLYDLEKNIKSHLISETEKYSGGTDLINLEFSDDSKKIYLDINLKEKEKYFVLEIDRSPPILKEREITPIPTNIKGNNYYLDNSGHLFKNQEKLTEKPFPVKAETKYSLEIFQDFLFLVEGENLYLFSPESKSFEKFFEGIKNLKISPDNKKLVFFSNWEIWILFLKDEGRKKAGEKLFLSRLSEKIGNVFWLNSDYLIFNSGDNLKIIEIDERDRIQIWDIGNFPNPEIYFNQTDKKLYILSEGNLFSSEKLIGGNGLPF